MDKKLKAKWVKALRSGRYEQTTGHLHLNGGYCCLGVLCRVMGLPIAKINEHFYPSALGVKTGIPGAITQKLATMNDGKDGEATTRKSFKEIAAFIEAKL